MLLLVFPSYPPLHAPLSFHGPQSLALLLSSAATRRLSAPAAPGDAGRPPPLPLGEGVVS